MKISDRIIRKASNYYNKSEEKKIDQLIPKIHTLDYDFRPLKNAYLKRILQYAYDKCPYYNTLFNESSININDENCLSNIPFLTRTKIRENKDSIISKQSARIYHYFEKTGGTTGEPLSVALTYKAQRIDHLHYNHYAYLMGYELGDVVVSFGGSPLPDEQLAKGVYWKHVNNINDLPYGRINFSKLYYNKDTATKFAAKIKELNPAILRGAPSFVCEISDDITFLKNKIKAIMLTSETILPWQMEMLKEKFGCKLYLQYGHTELSTFNYTVNETYKYYSSPLIGWIEILDEKGNHVKEGETGEIVTTGFHNNIMPFIRYRTNDLAQYLGEKNGVVILGRIEGRTQDRLIDRTGRKVTLYDFHRYTESSDKISAFQMHQFEAGKLLVKVIPIKEFNDEDKKQFIQLLDKSNFDASVEIVDELPITARGKRIWVVQHLEGI